MKNVTITLFFFSLLIFFSCSNGVNIEIQNNSKLDLEKIVLTTSFVKKDLGILKTKETKKIFLDFTKNKVNNDGIMRLSIYKKGLNKNYNFGYYSNGIPPKDVVINIKKDTVIFSQSHQ